MKSPHNFKVQIFGPFQANLNNDPLTTLYSRKARALLAYLLVEANRPHSRGFLATLLWSNQTSQKARTNLRTTFSKLRKLLTPLKADRPLFTATRQTIQLNLDPAHHWVDVAVFNDLLANCEGEQVDIPACAEAMTQAVTLYRGEFLSDLFVENAETFEAWRLEQQEKYHLRVLSLLNCLTGYYLLDRYNQVDYQLAEQYARQQLKLEPWYEMAHTQLMEILAKTGQKTAALAQYETCRRLLAEELGAELSPETVALAEQIRRGEFTGREAGEQESVETEKNSSLPSASSASRLDLSEAPLTGDFFGRTAELTQLQQWLVVDRCRLVMILGMGGLGKTSLAAQAARTVAGQFEAVIWRSLLNAPTLDELLPGILQTLSGTPLFDYPDSPAEKLSLLLNQLRQNRCLLVLDNLETILQSGLAGQYHPGYEDFGQLIETVARYEHQSCLLLTSREHPPGRLRLSPHLPGVQTLLLAGLDLTAGHKILQAHHITVTADQADQLLNRYSGNPLALNLLAQTIRDFYFGDVESFLGEETPIFDDIRGVLDEQFNRLSSLEQDILLWLAVAREPLFTPDLADALIRPARQRELLETLRSLERCSLLERSEAGFMLQNVVTEYLTDTLIEQVSKEIEHDDIKWLNSHALLQAQAKTYVRQSQLRLILQPIAERLAARLGVTGIDQTCRRMLDRLRQSPPAPGYAAGNLLNLLLYLKIDIAGYDFSCLHVWQADLQGKLLPEVNFSGAHLSRSTFTDVFGFVFSTAFSPNGHLLAAGTADGSVRLWCTKTYRPVAILFGHTEVVWSIAFSSDGAILASASADGTVRLWDVETNRVCHILNEGKGGVQAVAFSPNGLTLATGGEDCAVCLWNLDDIAAVEAGQPAGRLQGHTNSIQSLAFSPDGQTLVSASRDHTVRLWNVADGQCLRTISDHTNWVNAVAFSPNGQTLVSTGEDGMIYLWDASAARLTSTSGLKPCKILSGHKKGVQALAFSSDGQTLASGGNDHTVRLWDTTTGRANHILRGHTNWVKSVAFSPNGQTLASGSWDHTVRLWDLHRLDRQTLRMLQGHTCWVFGLAFSPVEKLLASGHSDHMLRLWDTSTGRLRHTLQGHTNWVWHVAFSPDGRTLASSSFDNTVRLWDIGTGQTRHILRGHQGGVEVVAFSPDGRTLASSSLDYTVRLWDTATGQLRQTIQHNNWCQTVAFSPDGRVLASGGADRSVILWDTATGQPGQILEGHSNAVQNVTFSPDGTLLASISWDKTVRLWEVASGKVLHVLRGHTNLGKAVAFSPDGRVLASCAYDQTVRLWDVKTGQLCHILEGHTNWVFFVAFSPNGQTLVSGGSDEIIRLWDVHSGKCLDTWPIPGPYEGMNISGVIGIELAQQTTLKALGAVEEVVDKMRGKV